MHSVTIPEDADSAEGTGVRRRRWGRWVLLVLLLLVLALAGTYFNWSRRADRDLTALLDELKRNGEPVLPEDLNGPPVDPEQDAAIDLRTAAKLIDVKSEAWEKYRKSLWDGPLGPRDRASLAKLVEGNRAALAKVREARGKRDADWKIRFQAPLIMTLLPHLSEQRNVAELCRLASVHERINGNHAAAMEYLRDVMVVGRAVDRQPFYVCHLVAVGIHAMAAANLGEMAPELKIKAGRGNDTGGAATPEQVRAAIAELLDERSLEAGIQQAIRGERVGMLDTARLVADRKLDLNQVAGGGGLAPLLPRPMILTDARIVTQYLTDVQKAHAAATDYPTFATTGPPIPPEVDRNRKFHILASILLPASDRFVLQQYRVLTDRRLAATALALRLYAVEHDGNYPKTLDALVPKYLPAVPKDPFAAGGKPLSYSTAADPKEPIVYSVGENGTDAGGSTAPKNRGRANSGRWETDDVVLQMRVKKLLKETNEEGEDGTEDGE
jgi:hypothetical protein